jgi:rod shape-determining protein MreD
VIRDLTLLALGFLLLAASSALGAVLDIGLLMPTLTLPIVIYLGMVVDVSLARGALLSFALGLLADSFSGNAMGPMTFVHEAIFLVTRGAGFRLLMRGRVSQVLITSFAALVSAVTVVALRSIFRSGGVPFDATNYRHMLVAVIAPALSTGAVSPFVFQLVRGVDSFRRREDTAVLG